VRLRVRDVGDPRCIQLARSLGNAVLSAMLATGLLLMLTCLLLLTRRVDESFARNAVAAVTALWTCCAFLGIQTSVAAVVPATIAGSLIGIGVELVTAFTTKDTHGGGSAGAAVGTFMGVAAAYQWHLSATRPGTRAIGATQWRWTLKAALVAICTVLILASLIAGLLVPTNGNLKGGLAVVVALLIAVVPFAAIWIEVSYWGRLKEFFRHGARPAATLLGAFLAIGSGIWLGHPGFQQSKVYGGFVAGPVSGLCVSVAYMMSAAILGTRMPPHVRALGAVSGVMVSLVCLAILLPLILPGFNINDEVWLIVVSCAVAMGAGGLIAKCWLRGR